MKTNTSNQAPQGERMWGQTHVGRWANIISWGLIALSLLISYQRYRGLEELSFLVPQEVFHVSINQTVNTDESRVKLKTYLPLSDARQTILEEHNASGSMSFQTSLQEGDRVAEWRSDSIEGGELRVDYSFKVQSQGVRYELDPQLPLKRSPKRSLKLSQASKLTQRYLEPTPDIQSTHEDILALAQQLSASSASLIDYLRSSFEVVQAMTFKPFKGTTDALTALKLGEASCNGRARLFVALMRAQGLPARLVGGIVMTQGVKRTSHQWAEVLISGRWVPFDPTNRHFAELPHHYLTLYHGDHVLFTHTADIAFKHSFEVNRRMVPRQVLESGEGALGLWSFFSQIGIPLELLMVVIMIPLGAVVVVLFRNVVGLKTFGTFLPVLIASSARHTGLMWGAIGFVLLILIASLVRRCTARLELLHSPQLAVMLTAVIGVMLFGGRLAVEMGFGSLGKLSLFPVAIIAITAERFTLMEIEDGWREAWATMLRTLVVVGFCAVVINSLSLQILMMAFPELLFVVAALNIWLGRWVGLRLSEWVRFHGLLWSQPQETMKGGEA